MRADVRAHVDAGASSVNPDVTDTRRAVRKAALRLTGPPLSLAGQVGRWRARARHRGPSDRPLRVVLIRPDHLGDVLLATPAAELLRAALPGCEVDWLVGPWSAAIAQGAGDADNVSTVAFPGFNRGAKRTPYEPYVVLLREATSLRARQYDAALILRPDHWWGAMLATLAGIPRRFGFSVAECQPFLTDSLPVPGGHVVRANQDLARLAALRLGGNPSAQPVTLAPTFPVLPDDTAWADARLRSILGPAVASPDSQPPCDPLGPTGPLVAIHAGTGAPVKNWLPERWADLARTLQLEQGAKIVLTGGPGERALVDEIAARIDPAPAMLVGQTTIGQLAALFSRCDLVIGGDSGPLHLAAAVGTPTVRLYGPTDIREFGPWPPGPAHAALTAGLPCQPCRNLVAPPCGAVETPACMRGLELDAVLEATRTALRLVAGPSAAGPAADTR